MQVRYRILSSMFDSRAYDSVLEAGPRRNRFIRGHQHLLEASARGSAPLQVSADEGTASLEEVRQRVRSGELKLTDLVDVGQGWEMVGACALLDEACEPQRRQAARRKVLFWGGVFLLVLVLLGVLLVYSRLLTGYGEP